MASVKRDGGDACNRGAVPAGRGRGHRGYHTRVPGKARARRGLCPIRNNRRASTVFEDVGRNGRVFSSFVKLLKFPRILRRGNDEEGDFISHCNHILRLHGTG